MTLFKTWIALAAAAAAAAVLLATGCSREQQAADAGMRKTSFPGMVTAGGGTSGEVIARASKPATDASYAGSTVVRRVLRVCARTVRRSAGRCAGSTGARCTPD